MRFSHYDGLTPNGQTGGGGGTVGSMTEILTATDNSITQLTDSINNYDYIIVVGYVGDRNIFGTIPCDFIKDNYTDVFVADKVMQIANDGRSINFYFVNDSSFTYYQSGNYYLKKIYGVKL